MCTPGSGGTLESMARRSVWSDLQRISTMKTITYTNGVVQSKEDFLLQELMGLVIKARLTVSNDIDEINFQRDRVAMLESLIEDCYKRGMQDE